MSIDSTGIDPYDAVLADLKAKRDQIDQTIQMIESLRQGKAMPADLGGQQQGQPQSSNGAIEDGAFLGMTISDAAKKLLLIRKKALGNADFVAAFTAGGLALNSESPINTIGSVLTRRFNEKGDIVRVGRGIWGLKEWYPNRSFNKKDKGEADEKGEADAA